MSGACRKKELYQLETSDIRTEGNLLIVNLKDTKNKQPRTFTMEGRFKEIVETYMKMRKAHTRHSHFFVNYQKGECTVQRVGENKLAGIPKQIATFLKLPDVDQYKGHSFRHTSTTILTDTGATMNTIMKHGGWTSETSAKIYMRDSIENKRKTSNVIQKSIASEPPTKKIKFNVASTSQDPCEQYSLTKSKSVECSDSVCHVSPSNSNESIPNYFEDDTSTIVVNKDPIANIQVDNREQIMSSNQQIKYVLNHCTVNIYEQKK